MPSFARAAKHLFLLTFLGCASIPSPLFVAAASDPTSTSTGSGWRSDLDWDGLASKLSSSTSLINTSFQSYREECYPEIFSEARPSMHALIDQPSGMCLNSYFFGWEMGWPRPSNNSHMNETFDRVIEDITPLFFSTFSGMELEGANATFAFLDDETNPSLDLPSKVLFPKVASDVVKIVLFAKKNGIELSVKNSGHSYTGSSSKKDTLLLNMNRFVHYAPDGITDCDAALSDAAVADDLSNQACILALARGKSSLIRVGGGENFDKLYRAVLAANQALDEYKYHVVGGNAGTVSPMGWSWLGGHAGAKAGRIYGMGVDQVLQVEMVLPNGYHVKFGPTEWEDASADGFIVPRTTVVSGVCRSNPDEEDEEKWIWGVCPEDFDINFGDLWFAVRGGGGGTWGVVTSATLQLHPYLPYKRFGFASVECSPLAPKYEVFRGKYFMTPSILNVTKENSIACGTSDTNNIYCYGDEDVLGAWERFLELNNIPLEVSQCLYRVTPDAKSFTESMMDTMKDSRFPGKVPDAPPPTPLPDSILGMVLVPQSWIDESEENLNFFVENGLGTYYSHGVAIASVSDQANSLSQSQRNAAAMANLFSPSNIVPLPTEANFWSNIFPKMYDISDKTNFPPVFNANHAGPLLTGPLKEDWTKFCPYELTLEERKEKCISSQEAIYGTELLNRLEAIKMAVDPDFMFNCHNCIGNNLDLAKASHAQDDESVPPTMAAKPSDEPSGASAVSLYAAVISATVLQLFLIILN